MLEEIILPTIIYENHNILIIFSLVIRLEIKMSFNSDREVHVARV